MMGVPELKQLAYYYPHPLWRDGDWIKSVLLFFDGIAVLLPSSGKDKPMERDPSIAIPLQERGLLRVLQADEIIDAAAAESMVTALSQVIERGALDDLQRDPATFHTLSPSRLGYLAQPEQAELLVTELERRGLARREERHIWMQAQVRLLILLFWAQLIRPAGHKLGIDLQPATENPQLVQTLEALLDRPSMPSTGHVVSSDLNTVGVDLGPVPIDEVLDFREQHGASYRAYARNLRQFVTEAGQISVADRAVLLKSRQEEIRDAADDLRRLGKKEWQRPATFLLGCGGAAWAMVQGDALSAAMSVSTAALASSALPSASSATAFNYLFKARDTF
jgi:energy-converting hydrogenase Eha subunit C